MTSRHKIKQYYFNYSLKLLFIGFGNKDIAVSRVVPSMGLGYVSIGDVDGLRDVETRRLAAGDGRDAEGGMRTGGGIDSPPIAKSAAAPCANENSTNPPHGRGLKAKSRPSYEI